VQGHKLVRLFKFTLQTIHEILSCDELEWSSDGQSLLAKTFGLEAAQSSFWA